MAQSVEDPTLDFGLGRDLTVREFEPRVGLYTVRFSLSLPLSLPFPCSLSLSQNK